MGAATFTKLDQSLKIYTRGAPARRRPLPSTILLATSWTYSALWFAAGEFIDSYLLLSWKVKVRNLLSKLCGEDSQYFKQFERKENGHTTYGMFKAFKAVFLAAKEDFEGGYLSSLKTLVQAEVFDSQFEQANEFFSSGYYTAAAVIAGVVLVGLKRQIKIKSSIIVKE